MMLPPFPCNQASSRRERPVVWWSAYSRVFHCMKLIGCAPKMSSSTSNGAVEESSCASNSPDRTGSLLRSSTLLSQVVKNEVKSELKEKERESERKNSRSIWWWLL